MKDVAVILLNYISWEDTLNEVQNLGEGLDIPYDDIIVIDNASPNNSSDMLSSKAKELGYTFLYSDYNGGYASGNNIGLRYALEKGYRYGWILNNDICIKDKNILHKLKTVLESVPDVAVVNPDIYAPDGHMYNRDAVRPSIYYQTIGALSYIKHGRRVENLGGYGYIYRPQGCCMLLDLNKCSQVDFLDENTFLYFEENILAERLLKKGYRCACCMNAAVTHNTSKTVRSQLQKKKLGNIKRSSYRYYLKKYRHYDVLQCEFCVLFYRIKCLILD